MAELARLGSAATSKQLDRWRLAGVLASPRLVHTRGQPGSRAIYPRASVEQVLAIEAALSVHRRLDFVIAKLWWDGFWVEPRRLRAALDGQFAPLLERFEMARAAGGDALGAAEQLADCAAGEPRRRSGPRVLRRGVRGTDRRALMVAGFQVLFGGEPAWRVADSDTKATIGDLAERFSGVERAKHDPVVHGAPWLCIIEQLPELLETWLPAGQPHYRSVLTRIGQASLKELDRTRDMMRWCSEVVPSIAAVVEARFGADAGGIGDLPLLFSAATTADFAIMALIGLYLADVDVLPASDVAVAAVLSALGLAPADTYPHLATSRT